MNKNKQIIIAIAAAAIILIGAGGIFAFSQNNKKVASENKTVAIPEEKNESMMASSIVDLIKSGQTTQCTFNYETDKGGSSNGTFYISADKIRGDIKTTEANGKDTNINMLKNGDTTYIWGDSLPMGIKMTMSIDELAKNDQLNQYLDTNKKGDFKCTSWTVDSSKFESPSGIKFTDMSAMMEGVMKKDTSAAENTSNPADKIDCSVCDNLQGIARNTCRQQLSCQ